MIALEISSRTHAEHAVEVLATGIGQEGRSADACVAALQERRDRMRAGLDLIWQQRGVDMADVPGGSLAWSRLFAELRGHERQAAEELIDAAGGDHAGQMMPEAPSQHWTRGQYLLAEPGKPGRLWTFHDLAAGNNCWR